MYTCSALMNRVSCFVTVLLLSACAAASENKVSGTLILGTEKIVLKYAYVDEVQPSEPIVVLSDQPLPASAIPFIPEKLVDEVKVHAIAFSVSSKDKTMTNNFGKLYLPGHNGGVGLGRVEDGDVKLTIKQLNGSVIEGSLATTRVINVIESVPPYSFDATFTVELGKGRSKP
jgi:hypothetical protein